MTTIRIDELLVKQGLCESRAKAQALIKEGQVWVDDVNIKKASKLLPPDTIFTLKDQPRYVSRGGYKLEAFIKHFELNIEGRTALDIGASTGGFTDCMLQYGAKSVTCVDVGKDQLHKKIKEHPAVTNLEKVNARYLKSGDLPLDAYDLIVADVSFISLTKILPSIWPWLSPHGGWLVLLVKPQFEASKEELDQCKGVIKDPSVQDRVIEEIIDFCQSVLPGSDVIGYIDSPITGGDGNREFLLGISRKNTTPLII